jgi:energy-converting hydrogenase Eha subunit A
VTVEAVPVNCAVDAPEATETVEGTVNLALPEVSATEVADATFAERVRVQVVVPAPVIEVGLQATEETVMGALSVTVAVEFEEPSVAVTTADWSLVTAEAVPVNCAVDAPEATETEEGTVSFVLPELSETEVADATFAERVRVQVVVPAPVIEVGLQATEETVIGAFSVTVAVEFEEPSVAVTTAD